MYTDTAKKYKYIRYWHKRGSSMTTDPKRSISLYLSYAQKDEALKEELEDYLVIMQQSGQISGWAERQVQPGTDWSRVIDSRLLAADLVLLLVSPSWLASGYCSGVEMREAFKRSEAGETRIIPIILHYVNLKGNLLERILSLPRNGISVSSWPKRNEAWQSIDQEIRNVIKGLLQDWG
jgi:TIR domain